jgi:hypothetical protein
MDDQHIPPPGLLGQARVRTTARMIAVVLLVVGAVLGISGVSSFVSEIGDPMMIDAGPGSILRAAGGGFCIVLGLVAAQIGWLRAQVTYVAGETMPVLKDSATYLSDGQGLGAIGRTAQPGPSTVTGPYCRQCGTRNDVEARFCDACGQSLA